MPVKLFNLNIEGDKHFQRWLPVALKEKPGVVCLQEVFGADMDFISDTLGMTGYFVPTMDITEVNTYNISPRGLWGLGFFTNLEHSIPEVQYYAGEGTIAVFKRPEDSARALVTSRVTAPSGEQFNIATTHFTWTHNGEANENQRKDLTALLEAVEQYPDIILCGDFNAPRGKEIFDHLASVFHDNLPPDVISTLDADLHYKKGTIQLAVDTIFSSGGYTISDCRVLTGISDHAGLVADISCT